MQVSFDEYDKIMEKFDNMNTETYWPTKEQIDRFEEDPDKWLMYSVYNYEKGKPPVNNAEKYSKMNLLEFINRHLEIV